MEALHPGLPDDAARFGRAFSTTHYVYLSRQDKVAQAVSLTKAEQTGLWHVHADGRERERIGTPRPVAYDSCLLAKQLEELRAHDAAWQRWFESNRIEPLPVTYEALSEDPQAVLHSLLGALGLDQSAAAKIKPRTGKLANEESRDWIVRLRRETDTEPR